MQDRIFYETKRYILQVIPQKQQLQIILKLFSYNKIKMLRATLNNENLPPQVQRNLRDIQIIYDLFQDQESFEVSQQGNIVLITSIIINKRKIQTKTQIRLQQQQFQKINEELHRQIKSLKIEMQKLRKTIQIKNQNHHYSNQQLMNSMRRQMKRQISTFKKQFIFQYQISDAKKKQNQNQKYLLQQKIKNLQNQLQQALSIKQKFKKHQTIFYKDISIILQRLQIVQHKVGQIVQKFQNSIQIRKTKINNNSSPINPINMNYKIPNKNVCNYKMPQVPKLKSYDTQIQIQKIKESQQKKSKNQIFKNQKTKYDMTNLYSKYFSFSQRNITYIGDDRKWTLLLGNQVLNKGFVYEFMFKIKKSKYGNIDMGFCNRQLTKKLRKPITTESVLISGDTGQVICLKDRISHFGGIKPNFTIKLILDFINHSIKFNINQNSLTLGKDQFYDFLQGSQIVPFVCFYRKGDVVQWIK